MILTLQTCVVPGANFNMKSLLIIYPHWPPSNLAGVHRPRLIANYLEDFGWHPVVLTVRPEYYEEKPDWDLCKTVSGKVEVHYTNAFRVTKPRLIGDIGLRAFWQIYQAAIQIIKQKKIDFIWIPIPSFYTALIGRLLYEKTKIPYGIDYIDPWVRDITGRRDWRHVLSNGLAKILEPIAIKKAALITGVAEEYYMPALSRNFKKEEIISAGGVSESPAGNSEREEENFNGRKTTKQTNKSTIRQIFHLRLPIRVSRRKEGTLMNPIHHLAFPYGFDPRDHQIKLENVELPWQDIPNCKPLVYAGAFLPNSRLFIECLFKAIADLIREKQWDENCHLFFLGTGSYPGKSIAEYAIENGIERYVHEVRERFPFLHILNFLSAAFGVMVIGSTEKHYTASKTYQAIMSKRLVLAVLHEESSAVQALNDFDRCRYLTRYKNETTSSELTVELLRNLSKFLSQESKTQAINSAGITKWSSKRNAKDFAYVLTYVIKD